MNSADKQAVLHCLKSMIDEEVCEECPLYGTTGTDHCEKDCVRLAINELEKEPCDDCISRKQAIELFVGWWSDLLEYHKEDECFDALLKALPPVTPQQKTGYISIDDAMSAFDDFMCNDIEPEGQEVFLELLKDRAERSGG